MASARLTTINGILALAMVIVLALPVATAYYSDFHKGQVVIEAQSSGLLSPTYIGPATLNYSLIDGVLPSPTLLYDEPNNDTWIEYYDNPSNNGIALFNSATLIGDDTVISGINYSKLGQAVPNIDSIGVQLNYTASELLDQDFLKLVSNDEHGNRYIGFFTSASTIGLIQFKATGNDTWILTLDLTAQASLMGAYADDLFLIFLDPDETDTAWTYSLSYDQLSNEVWAWDDFQLYGLSIAGSVAILSMAIALNTDTLDIKIDRNRKDGR